MSENATGGARIDTVLLDVDGTLVDSSYHHALAWARAFARHDLHPPLWRIHRSIGMGGDKLVQHVTTAGTEVRFGDALREAWTQEYRTMVADVRPCDGARDLVLRLRGRGLTVALATSGETEFTETALKTMGITRDDVDAVVSASDVADSKPAPDIFAAALDAAGGSRAIVIGDSPWDVEAARRTGARALTVRTGGFSAAELRAAGALHVADDVAALVEGPWQDWLGVQEGLGSRG